MELKSLLLLNLLIISGVAMAGQDSGDSRSHTIFYREGIPAEIRFDDGRVAEFVGKKERRVFKTTLTLIDNTCTPQQQASCEIQFPYTARRFAMIWKNNPTRQGEVVLAKDNSEDPTEIPSSLIAGVGQFPIYEGSGTLTNDPSSYGEIKCDNNDWVPRKTKVGSLRPPLEGITLTETADNRLLIHEPKIRPTSSYFKFPLMTHKLRLSFLSPRLEASQNQKCAVTFATDYNKILEEFNELTNSQKQPYEVKDFKPLDRAEDLNQMPSYWFGEGHWPANAVF